MLDQRSGQVNRRSATNLQWILVGLNKIAWLIAIAAVSWLGEHEKQGGFIKDLWEQAKVASPFAAMLMMFLFFDERRERREAQKQCQDRTIEFIDSNNIAHNALDKMSDALPKRRGR